uniref:CPG4 domain-containing protein n=1 Tax=Strongyloides papillosus TaxID=174720 RepID=A0A0N5BDC5_STREA
MFLLYFFTMLYLPLIYSKPLSLSYEERSLMDKLANFKFDSLFNNFKGKTCSDECFLSSTKSSAKSLTEAFFSNLKDNDNMCQNSYQIERCIKEKRCKNDWLADAFMLTYKITCQKYNKDDANINDTLGKIKCLQNDPNGLLVMCSKNCSVQSTIEKITNLDEEVKMIDFVNEEDKKVLALPDVSPVCQSSTCFLACVKNNLDKECEEDKLSSFMNLFGKLLNVEGSFSPGKKVRDLQSYFEYMIQSQCKNIVGQKNVVKIKELKSNLPSSVGMVRSVPVAPLPKDEECEGCGKDRFDYMYQKNSTEMLSSIMSQIRSSLDMLFNS